MYSITVDTTNKLLRVKLSGFLMADEVKAFGNEVQVMVANLGYRSGEHSMMVDTSECTLQAQEVVACFQHVIASAPIKSRRIAVVTGSSLSRMQTRRILVRDQAMMFDSAIDAEHWVLTGNAGEIAA
jgi:hypothetical protein